MQESELLKKLKDNLPADQKERLDAMKELFTLAQTSGSPAAMDAVLKLTRQMVEKCGLSDIDGALLCAYMAISVLKDVPRVEKCNEFATIFDLSFLFQSDPPSIEVYQDGEFKVNWAGKDAADLFDMADKFRADVAKREDQTVSQHDAVRALLVYSFLREQAVQVKERMRERVISELKARGLAATE